MKKRLKKNEEGIRELQDNMKHNNICIIGIPEGEEEQGKEKRLRKHEEALRELQDNMKHNNIHKIGIPEGEEEQGIENLL